MAPWIGAADKRRAIKEFGTYYYFFSGCLDLVIVLISSLSSLVCRFFVVSLVLGHFIWAFVACLARWRLE